MKIEIKLTYYCSVISAVVVNFVATGIWFLQHLYNSFLHATLYQLVVLIAINIVLTLIAAHFISQHIYAKITSEYIELNELFRKHIYTWDAIQNIEYRTFLNFHYLVISAENKTFIIPFSCTNQNELKAFIKTLKDDNILKQCQFLLDYFHE